MELMKLMTVEYMCLTCLKICDTEKEINKHIKKWHE